MSAGRFKWRSTVWNRPVSVTGSSRPALWSNRKCSWRLSRKGWRTKLAPGPIRIRGMEVGLEQVAPETGIDQIVVAIIAAGDHGGVMVHGQFAADILFAHTTVSATGPIPVANLSVPGVGHCYSSTPRSCRVS